MKETIRKRLIHRRNELSEIELQIAEKAVFDQIQHFPLYQKAKKIGLYMAIEGEIGTTLLLQDALANKEVYLPKCVNDTLIFYKITSAENLTPNHFGILEPVPENPISADSLDLIFIPAVGVDYTGVRLGYGKGYYDRVLTNTMPTVALIYDFQFVTNLPQEPWDKLMRYVITPQETRALHP